MASISLHFHATKVEIIDSAKEWLKLYDLFMVCIQLTPVYKCELVNKHELGDKKIMVDSSQIICLYRFEPDITPKRYLEFVNLNENGLIITIGEQGDNILKESIISTNCINKDACKLWRKIINNLKKDMLKGAWVINPHNGSKEFYKNHMYTNSAKKVFEDGVKICALAGWCIYILDGQYLD